MTALEEERIAAVAHEDMRLLCKEYARAGYKAVHGRGNAGFEAMWSQAFGAGPDEETPEDGGSSEVLSILCK